MKKKDFWFGFVLAMLVAGGCATTWKYYGEQFSDRPITSADVGKKISDLCYDEGHLLGKQGSGGWPDLSMTECKPDAVVTGKCVVQIEETYRALLKDDEDCHISLDDCEKGPPPAR